MALGRSIAVATLLSLQALNSSRPASAAQEPAPAPGARYLLPFKQELMKTLTDALENGAAPAVEACQVKAPQIAAANSVNGIMVGRSSHRLRNPANRAPEWVAPILAAYVAQQSGWQARTVALDDGRTGYVEPIVLQPLCVACHGEALTQDVSRRISAAYPQDQATGFKAGDLRGVFWVTYPAAVGQ